VAGGQENILLFGLRPPGVTPGAAFGRPGSTTVAAALGAARSKLLRTKSAMTVYHLYPFF